MGLMWLVLLLGIAYSGGKEATKTEAAKANAGHWAIDPVKGDKRWCWGPALGTWQYRALKDCNDFRSDAEEYEPRVVNCGRAGKVVIP
jgi:hypothetical protein